jgi:hypothetical protein
MIYPKTISVRVRTKPEQIITEYTLSPNEIYNISMNNLDTVTAIILFVKAEYTPYATAGIRIRWLYSPDGIHYDTPEEAEASGNYEDIGYVPGNSRQKTIIIPVLAPNLKIQFINLDTQNQVTISVWRALLGYS